MTYAQSDKVVYRVRKIIIVQMWNILTPCFLMNSVRIAFENRDRVINSIESIQYA